MAVPICAWVGSIAAANTASGTVCACRSARSSRLRSQAARTRNNHQRIRLHKPAEARAFHEYFSSLYGILKHEARHIRFLFITGITRFEYVEHPRREMWRLHYHSRAEHLQGIESAAASLTLQE